PDHEVGSRAQQLGQALRVQSAVIVTTPADRVGVGVRRTRHLPDPDVLGVWLFGQPAPEEDDVRLALQHQHGHPYVLADALTLGRDGTAGRLNSLTPRRGSEYAVNRHAHAGPPVYEEAIEELCVGINGVDVRHQAGGGLRLASRDEILGHKPAERVLVAWHPEQCTDLSENVEGPRVPGVFECAVTLQC